MSKANLTFGAVSLLLGLGLIMASLLRGQAAFTVGTVFGGLLVLNAAARLWAARGE